MQTETTTGAQRARAIMTAKHKANTVFYAALPRLGLATLNLVTTSRQTKRRAARKLARARASAERQLEIKSRRTKAPKRAAP